MKVYNLNGILSTLPVFWETITTDNEYIVQVGCDGEPANHWCDLDPDKTKYWGIISHKGKIGYDLENNEIIYNGSAIRLVNECSEDNFTVKQQEFKGPLFFERRVLVIGTESDITEAITFGVGDHRLIVRFYPDFSINIVSK